MTKIYSRFTLSALSLCLLAGCSSPIHLPSFSNTENTEPIEPTIVEQTSTTQTQYEYITTLTDLDIAKNSVPYYFNGYYFVRDTSDTISILNEEGEVVATDYSKVTFVNLTDAMLTTTSGETQTLAYAVGNTETNIVGGLGGMDNRVYVYDTNTEEVLQLDMSANTESNEQTYHWVQPDISALDENESILLYSKEDYEKHSTPKNFYIWNIPSNCYYGPFSVKKYSSMFYQDTAFEFYHLTDDFLEIDGIYPTSLDTETTLTLGNKQSADSYTNLKPVGDNAYYGLTADKRKVLIEDQLDNILYLPEDATLCSKLGTDTILLKIDNEWQLWKVSLSESNTEANS